MRTVFGQQTNPFSFTKATIVIVPKTDSVIGITNVVESDETVTITFHIPEIDSDTQNMPVELYAVFCNNNADSFAGPDATLANGTFPKVQAELPEDFSVAQEVTATMPTSAFVQGKTYSVFSIVRYN